MIYVARDGRVSRTNDDEQATLSEVNERTLRESCASCRDVVARDSRTRPSVREIVRCYHAAVRGTARLYPAGYAIRRRQ